MNQIFVGTYQHNVDSKGRVSLPALFRKNLATQLFVTAGPEQALLVFTPEKYQEWVMSLFAQRDGGYNPRSARDAKLMRDATKDAYPVELDSAGRINLPAQLREKAGISKEVNIVGSFDHFEIWDSKAWGAHEASSPSFGGYFESE